MVQMAPAVQGGHCGGSLFGPGGGGGPGGPFPEGPLWGRGGHLGFGGRPPLLSFSLLVHNTSANMGLAGSHTPNCRGEVGRSGQEGPSCCIISAVTVRVMASTCGGLKE